MSQSPSFVCLPSTQAPSFFAAWPFPGVSVLSPAPGPWPHHDDHTVLPRGTSGSPVAFSTFSSIQDFIFLYTCRGGGGQ